MCIWYFSVFSNKCRKKNEKLVKQYGEIHVQETIKLKLADQITQAILFVN